MVQYAIMENPLILMNLNYSHLKVRDKTFPASLMWWLNEPEEIQSGDAPGVPVVKTPYSQGRGHGFSPRFGTKIPHSIGCA